jgi:cytochrome d ubiquinol oxidase subunit I
MMEQVLLARIQFGMTIGFHFLFPPVSIGLAWLLVWLEARAAKREDAAVLSRLFGKVFAILYIIGIATGVVMSLQFGTNWSRFANFVNGVFGPILVAEVLIAFFLESIFFGIWLFGRGRVSETLRRLSIFLVAFGATVSAFWITAADSWMQTPAGYALSTDGKRALLTDFWAAVFNPSTLSRFSHVMMSAATITGFFVAALAAYLVLREKGGAFARKVLTVGVVIGLAGSVLVIGTGVNEAFRLGGQQIEKVNVFRGIAADDGPVLGPGSDSVSSASVADQSAPLPPRFTKTAFWIMASLGVAFGIFTLLMFLALVFRLLSRSKFLLWCLVGALPLPVVATEFGWMAAEVGRQPWIVYKLLKTSDAVSVSVTPGMLVFSLVLIGLVYALFLGVSVGMVVHEVRKTPSLPESGAKLEGGHV